MLGRYDRAMRARQPVGGQTLLARAIAAIRRNNGTLFYVPANFAGAWTDSAGTDPVDAIGDVIGRMTDRTGGGAVATQATTANKPTVQVNAQGRYVMSFDGSNDFLQTSLTTGNEGWVCVGASVTAFSANGHAFIGNGATTSTNAGMMLYTHGTGGGKLLQMVLSNGTTRILNGTNVTPTGTPFVADGGWSPGSMMVALNGVEQSFSTAISPTTSASVTIGLSGTWPLNGLMTAQVIFPALPSAADRALIRRWIGSLQG